MAHDADVIVVGAGLSGLVATAELVDAGRKVLLLDQEPEQSLGGQAFWSFGGLFLVNSPEQRLFGVRDNYELAMQDWLGTAGFDRETDHWPRQWAHAYVDFATTEKRAWLHAKGVRWFPVMGWIERGGYLAWGHGNSVPRFHITWGTGPGILEPFIRRVRQAEEQGLVTMRFRHRVTELVTTGGIVTGVRGDVLEPSAVPRGQSSSRTVVNDFEFQAQAVVVTSGGIGGNHSLVRRNWPKRMGKPPKYMLSGVPDYVDGKMLQVVNKAGGHIINSDRMWHYPEGIANYDSVWPSHGIRILSGPTPLWLDANGNRLPSPLFPGFDTLGALQHIAKSGHEHSWFLLNQRTIGREFALSGSEQNPDLTEKNIPLLLQRVLPGATKPVEEFTKRSREFIFGRTVAELAQGMNKLSGEQLIDARALKRIIVERDREVLTGLGKDLQVNSIYAARRFLGDRLIRVTKPHALLDPSAGPLIAVRLSILTRKTLGGLETDLSGRVLQDSGEPLAGVYAAGEAAGFGGGGVHGYRALEGTFLGGCLFSGRVAGRAAAAAVE